jgi:hypothetical protein
MHCNGAVVSLQRYGVLQLIDLKCVGDIERNYPRSP